MQRLTKNALLAALLAFTAFACSKNSPVTNGADLNNSLLNPLLENSLISNQNLDPVQIQLSSVAHLSLEFYTQAKPEELLQELKAITERTAYSPQLATDEDHRLWQVAQNYQLPSQPFAQDGIHFCNQTNRRIRIALGFQQISEWLSSGGIFLAPGACYSKLGNHSSQRLYYFAETTDSGPALRWEGSARDPQFCVRVIPFENQSRAGFSCWWRVGSLRNFRELRVTENRQIIGLTLNSATESVPIRQMLPGYFEAHVGQAHATGWIIETDWFDFKLGPRIERNRYLARSLLLRSLLQGYLPAAPLLASQLIFPSCRTEHQPYDFCFVLQRLALLQGDALSAINLAQEVHGHPNSPRFQPELALKLFNHALMNSRTAWERNRAAAAGARFILLHYSLNSENLRVALNWANECSDPPNSPRACQQLRSQIEAKINLL